jgi:ATP/maltotriose-dependent transcriptional regulator MalT
MGGPEHIDGGRSPITGAPAFVATKLAIPRVRDVSVRPQALAALADGARKRLTVVRAPAGYGKTTVVAEAAARLKWNVVWYKLDVLDHDPLVLIASLVQGLRQDNPTFGEILVERFADARDDPADINQLLALLVSELAAGITDELHLVLDDYHQAASSESLNTALDFLLANLPEHLHVVLLTRCLPSISVARLRLDDQVAEVDFEHLRFTADQARETLAAAGINVSQADAERLASLTEGWPASIAMAARALEWTDVSTMERALGDPRLKNDVFSYLADEALRHENGDVADFLAATCCLDSMTIALAAAVASSESAGAILRHLVEQNVFTFFDEASSTYRYHHLLRDYLCARHVQEHGPETFRQLQIGTAQAVESAGDAETAIELLFAANEPQLALDVVSRAGDLVSDNCRLDALRSWLDRLPGFLVDHNPWGIFLKGQLLWRAGDSESAIRELEYASAAFTEGGDRRGRYATLSGLESLHFWRGDFEEAARHCELALEQATAPHQTIHTLVSLGSAFNYSGRWDDAEAAWREAELLIGPHVTGEGIRIKALKGAGLYLRGQYRDAADTLSHARAQADQVGSRTFSILVATSLAECLCEVGAYGLAKAIVAECLEQCDKYRFDHIGFMAEESLAQVLLATGEVDSAESIFRRLLSSAVVAQDAWSLAFVATHYALALRLVGRIDSALTQYREAIAVATIGHVDVIRLDAEAQMRNLQLLSGSRDTALNDLDWIAKEARQKGYAQIELACQFFGGVQRVEAGDESATAALISTVRRQLDMGHVRFLGQELAAHTKTAARLLLSPELRGSRRPLLECVLGCPSGSNVLTAAVRHFPDQAESLVVSASGMLVQGQVDALLARTQPRERVKLAALFDQSSPEPRRLTEKYPLNDLTRRELQVLAEMAKGHGNADIAARLFVSEKTVKTHVNHIFMKLGVTNRVQAVLKLKQAEAESEGFNENTT